MDPVRRVCSRCSKGVTFSRIKDCVFSCSCFSFSVNNLRMTMTAWAKIDSIQCLPRRVISPPAAKNMELMISLKQQDIHLKKDFLQNFHNLRMAFKKIWSQSLGHDLLGHQWVLLFDLGILASFRSGRDKDSHSLFVQWMLFSGLPSVTWSK